MEQNWNCAQGASDLKMRIVPQQVESPPSKPPRRRYSDQISVSSLGTLSSNKKHSEENIKNDSKSKICTAKPTYLSLPSNLTSNFPNEHNYSSATYPYLSDQQKYAKQNESYKISQDKYKSLEKGTAEVYDSIDNKYSSKDKLLSVSPRLNTNFLFSKYHLGKSASRPVDKSTKNYLCCGKVMFTSNSNNQIFKPSYQSCHRRHHSDSAIYLNVPNKVNSPIYDAQSNCDNLLFSSKKHKSCDSTTVCSCCKENDFVMQEIQNLKEINDKLWQHLCSVRTSLENLRRKTYDECSDISISGLLSSIYYAQRAKDCAMEERLKIALQERDAAALELESIIDIVTKDCDDTNALLSGEKKIHKSIQELLHKIGYSPNLSRLLKYQKMLSADICRLKESKQDCLSHELRQTVDERDNALEKVAKLEEEIKGLKLCFDLWNLDNRNWEHTLFDILRQLIYQRDAILSNASYGLDIANSLSSCSSSRLGSLERHPVSQFEMRPKSTELKNHQSVIFNDCKQQHSFGTSNEVSKLKEKILILNKELDSEMKKREQAEGKCFRLERLIHILRKKLNGQNIGVPV